MAPAYVLQSSTRTEVCILFTGYGISSKTQSNFSIWMIGLNSRNMRRAEILCVPEHIKIAIGGFWMGRCCEVKGAIGGFWMGRCCVVNSKGEHEVKLDSRIYWYI